MNQYIKKLTGTFPFTERNFEINLDGKNLIITGGNGAGKTRLINCIHNQLYRFLLDSKNLDLNHHHNIISQKRKELIDFPKGTDTYKYIQSVIEKHKSHLNDIKFTQIELVELPKKILLSKNIKSLLKFYPADRKSDIKEPTSILSLNKLIDDEYQESFDSNAGAIFENYLVSYKTLQSHKIAIEKDNKSAKIIASWFDKITSDLRNLFEDNTLTLDFDLHAQKFFVKQKDKPPFSLQNLSAGFSAIMSIYADLIMKVQLQEIKPELLRGIVFIDEIDAHLHVSLQRKIFKFLKDSFPSIQFIISTHSPFVLMSVDDAIIYDISKSEKVDNVSLYSYDAVLEGIFNVPPISLVLEDKIKLLASLVEKLDGNEENINNLISQIKPMESKLDSESKHYFVQAEIKYLRRKKNV